MPSDFSLLLGRGWEPSICLRCAPSSPALLPAGEGRLSFLRRVFRQQRTHLGARHGKFHADFLVLRRYLGVIVVNLLVLATFGDPASDNQQAEAFFHLPRALS